MDVVAIETEIKEELRAILIVVTDQHGCSHRGDNVDVKAWPCLQNVRDINAGQARELETEKGRVKELQGKRREATQELEEARKATAAQAEELEVRSACALENMCCTREMRCGRLTVCWFANVVGHAMRPKP